jgi:hypothetical protein
VSLLHETFSSIADAADLWQVWTPILFFYGFSAVALLVTSPLLYGLMRIGKRLDRALGIDSAPSPIAADAFPVKLVELQRTMVRRGLVIAGVFDLFATPFALVYVIGYVVDTHAHISLAGAALYGGIALLAAAGCTALWIGPIGITTYLAERARLRRRVQRTDTLS